MPLFITTMRQVYRDAEAFLNGEIDLPRLHATIDYAVADASELDPRILELLLPWQETVSSSFSSRDARVFPSQDCPIVQGVRRLLRTCSPPCVRRSREISPTMRERLLRILCSHWQGDPDVGMWIGEHAALTTEAVSLQSHLCDAWFLSGSGLIHVGASAYNRFRFCWNMNWWHSGSRFSCPSPVSGVQPWQVGMAGFARYEGEDSYYLEFILGSLAGRGFRYAADAEGVLRCTDLWVS